jgi:glyoxylase-like metal-dependent hydrolase (beta-lactamase superfamily II)
VRADNPGPLTLTGTNSWLVGRDPCWVVDPGPRIGNHLESLLAEGSARGGIGGIAITHDHGDHGELAPDLAAAAGGVPVLAARHASATAVIAGGDAAGPMMAIAVPGHAPDHLCFAFGSVCFTGDAVLGEGSVFLWPDPGALAGYLDALEHLRAWRFTLLACGHGPLVENPDGKLAGYIAHRLAREQGVLAALARGARSVEELLDSAWAEVPEPLRPAAALTLAAHLDKLEDEGRLPDGVERPVVPTF